MISFRTNLGIFETWVKYLIIFDYLKKGSMNTLTLILTQKIFTLKFYEGNHSRIFGNFFMNFNHDVSLEELNF